MSAGVDAQGVRGAFDALLDDAGNPPCDPPDDCDVCRLFTPPQPGETRAAWLARMTAQWSPRSHPGDQPMLKAVVPPGHVDAYCTFCSRDVVIPEDTMACPHCGQNVNPLSLPVVPQALRTGAVVARLAQEPPPMLATVAKPARAPEPPVAVKPASAEPIVLPDSMLDWHADTVRRHAALVEEEASLVEEEASLVEELRRVRQMRKLLDVVLDRIAEPAEVAVPEPAIAVTPVLTDAAPAPAPASAAKSEPFVCRICLGQGGKNNGQGRCGRCAQHFRKHAVEWPNRADGTPIDMECSRARIEAGLRPADGE